MAYIATLALFLPWAVVLARRQHLSWHVLISLYVVGAVVVDLGDVAFDYWLNLYDLPAHLLSNPASDRYLGIIFSDGMIFPLLTIIFCCYVLRIRRPWLLSALFASFLVILEMVFRRLGFMVYHHWSVWVTGAISFVGLRIFAHLAHRFVDSSPPIPYWFRLLCFAYMCAGWPAGICGGLLQLYQWRLHVFADRFADDRFMYLFLTAAFGGLSAYFAPRVRPEYRFPLFLGLGASCALMPLSAHAAGFLRYGHWNDFWTVVCFAGPYLIIYAYDRWESAAVLPLNT